MKDIKVAAVVVLFALIAGCSGGGGGSGDAQSSTAPSIKNATPDDLTAAIGTASSSQVGSLCGYDVGPNVLQGSVSSVHDGDTITLDSGGTAYKIRLDSIDAPELAQPFGSLAQSSLASSVLGKTVQVAYTKTDRYGRLVGAVFTENCQYVNLNQVASGMAWYYKAYQCELAANVRDLFAKAQDAAVAAQLGLWSQQNPTAPWVYRNGVDPVVSACSSESAVFPGNPDTSSTSSSTSSGSSSTSGSSGTPASPPANSCFKVWVNPYVRSDGTHVKGYWRNSPGCP